MITSRKYSCIFGILVFSALRVLAFGDPDFEQTRPGELPQWSGAQWAKGTTIQYSAKIIADPASAASGKQYLRIENPNKTTGSVLAHPGIRKIDGFGLKLSCKVRGSALSQIGLFRMDENGKNRKWKNKQETGFKRRDPKKWETLELTYIPEDEDKSFMVYAAVRDGNAEFDDFKLEQFRIPAAAVKKAAPVKKAVKPIQTIKQKKSTKLAIYSYFENWKNNLPSGWKRCDADTTSSIQKIEHRAEDIRLFGRSGLLLNGKIMMDPPMRGLAVPRSRPMRLAFYAKGEHGRIRARLHEGRNGFVDYIVNLVDESTGTEWKKYAASFALPPACRIDNAAIELTGENVIIDNLEFKAATGGDGKLIYSIPIVKTAPVIDGKNSPGEWDFAVGASDPLQLANYFNALHAKPESPALSQQNTVRFCSDGKKLYFMFEVPEGAGFKRDFTKRDSYVYMDDSVELHINPEFGKETPRYSYQFVFNANNAVFDQRREKGGGEVKFHKWNARTLFNRSSVADGKWTLEGSVDLAELGLAPEKPFGINVGSAKRNPDEAGSLNGAGFLWLGFMPQAVISKNRPGVYWMKNGDWGSLLVNVSNAQAPAGNYTLNWKLDSEKTAVTRKQSIYLAPGRTVPVLFNVPGGAGKFGTFELTLNDRNRKTVFRQTMDFNSGITPVKIIKKDLEFHFLPEQKKFAVNIHQRGGWADRVARVRVTGAAAEPIVFEKADFTDFDGTLVVKKPFETENGKTYIIGVNALDKAGTVLAAATFKFTADDRLVPPDSSKKWNGVLPFYDPIKFSGKEAKIKLRTYTFAENGLPARILANGNEALHDAITFTAEDKNGKLLKGRNGKFKVLSSGEQKLVFTGETIFPGFTLQLKGTLEYDGAIFYNAKIAAPKPVEIKRLSVEVPLNKLDYFHSFVDSQLRLWMCRLPKAGEYRHASVPVWKPDTILYPQSYRRFTLLFFPDGDGVIWNSRNIVPGVIKNGFLPYLTAGNHKFGLEFFADTDRGWVHNTNSTVHEILRKNGKEIMRSNIIAQPWQLKGERCFEFGIMATPGRLKRRDYGTVYQNGYSHTGLLDQALAGLRPKDWNAYSEQVKRHNTPIQVICKGFYPQMDPVAQYMDSEWRTRPEYTFTDAWKSVSGRVYGTDQRYYHSPAGCFTPGRLNFYAERLEEFARKAPALQGVYWDENWMKPCNNPNHAECGYIMPDGQLQGRAWWTNIREVDRRVQHIFRRYGRKDPRLVMFTGEGLIPHAFAFGTMNWMGEHLTYDMDFIDYWTPHFTEIAYAGAWGFDVGGFGMFRDPKYMAKIHLNRAHLALFKLYDAFFHPVYFNRSVLTPVLNAEKRFGKSEKDVIFAGYFSEEGQAILPGLPVDVKASTYIRPGKGALVYVSNLGTQKAAVKLNFDLKKYNIRNFTAFNAETQKPVDLTKHVEIKSHDYLLLELKNK